MVLKLATEYLVVKATEVQREIAEHGGTTKFVEVAWNYCGDAERWI